MTDDSDDEIILDFSASIFGFYPNPKFGHLEQVRKQIEGFGYEMRVLEQGYTLEEVQRMLRTKGATAFLSITSLQEDISPKAPPKAAIEFVADRLSLLGPTKDLVIIDPYLFTNSVKGSDVLEYASQLSALIQNVVASEAQVTCLVKETNTGILEALIAEPKLRELNVTISVIETNDFHDRFWIANRSDGVVVGTSLQGLGKRLFFIDALKSADVSVIVQELQELGI